MFAKKNHLFVDAKGYSLVEMLVAISIAAIAMSALLSMNTTLIKANRNAEILTGLQDFTNILRMGLRNSSSCSLNLNTTNFNKLTVDNRVTYLEQEVIQVNRLNMLGQSAPVAETNKSLPGLNGVLIEAMQVSRFRDLKEGTSFMADLAITIRKPESALGTKEVTRSIPIYFKATKAGNTSTLISCSISDFRNLAEDDLFEIRKQVCDSMKGIFDNATGSCKLPTRVTIKGGTQSDLAIFLPTSVQMGDLTVNMGTQGDFNMSAGQLNMRDLKINGKDMNIKINGQSPKKK